jgi:hypothetical protein
MVIKFIPDSVLLEKIQIQNAYSDNISIEAKTGKKQAKYKLAICKILDIFQFRRLTTNNKSCDKRFTIKIYQKDWENADYEYLYAKFSFCDVTKPEFLNEKDILKKTRDMNNGFPFIGKLCNSCFKTILGLIEEIPLHRNMDEELIKNAEEVIEEIANLKIKELLI